MDERWNAEPGDDRPAPPGLPRPYAAGGDSPERPDDVGAHASSAPGPADDPEWPAPSRPSPYTLPSTPRRPEGDRGGPAPWAGEGADSGPQNAYGPSGPQAPYSGPGPAHGGPSGPQAPYAPSGPQSPYAPSGPPPSSHAGSGPHPTYDGASGPQTPYGGDPSSTGSFPAGPPSPAYGGPSGPQTPYGGDPASTGSFASGPQTAAFGSGPVDDRVPVGAPGHAGAPSGPHASFAGPAGPAGSPGAFPAEHPSGPHAAYAGGDDGADGGDDAGPGRRGRRKSRKGLWIGVLSAVVVLALVGGAASWYVLTLPRPADTAVAFAAAWAEQDYDAMAEVATGDGVAEDYAAVAENLGVEAADITLGDTVGEGDTATAPFTAVLSLSNAGDWTYEGELPLRRDGGEWRVAYTPSVLHPDLGEGQTLVRANEWGERGHILAGDGSRLDTEDASGSIRMLTGEVGTATAEDLERLGPAYKEGDPTGVGGLQAAYEERLAGTATTSIRLAETGEEDAAIEAAADDAEVVGSIEGSPGEDITTGIDPAVQDAAAQAIIGEDRPTSMVAIRPSTGEVLAAANVPGGFNRATEGQYPAGSTFKIVSYDALLDSGMPMEEQMACPETVDVGGRPFKNAGDAAYGAQTVTEAFATSCNTALVQKVAEHLDAAALVSTAEKYGFNSELTTGLPATFAPSFPAPDSTSMLAAASIGQGQMLTSPLHMATVPAAVADGSWRMPVFVTDPAVPDLPEPTPIANAESLRTMMRAVVTDGTAKDVGFTGEVFGKSGTAEYGTAEEGEELPAHGWFVGFEGDVAFAVVVEDGESGSKAAAPLARAFLDAL